MRRLVHVFAALWLLLTPAFAWSQDKTTPTIVMGLDDPDSPRVYSPWLGAIVGAAIAIVGANAWTGGALLAPTLGAGVSALAGGAWLGPAALGPLAAQSVIETSTLVTTGVLGGAIGYWLVSE